MKLITTGQVAEVLNLSPDMVRVLEKENKLTSIRTGNNSMRLFLSEQVYQLKHEREKNPPKPGPKGPRSAGE